MCDTGAGEGELDSSRRLGDRVARLAVKMKRAETPAISTGGGVPR
jgi:hypothetical protein